MAKEKITEMQLLQQNLQALLAQKQQFQMQLNEMDSAMEELKDAKQAYKIIGNVMVLKKSESLNKELTDKKKIAELRIKNIEGQEEKLKTNAEQLQKEIAKQHEE